MSTRAVLLTVSLLGVTALGACGTGSDLPPGSGSNAGGSALAGAGNAGTPGLGGGASRVGGSSGSSTVGGFGGSTSAGAAGTLGNAGQAGAAPVISGPPAAGSVFVHLFEWKWTDIAAECENYLGPAGFAGVQVSPPSEHALVAGYPWYERYQTVNYSLALSRSGTEAEFKDMVQRCARVGVGIYVDAVINHTTAGGSGVGVNGTKFTKYQYPNLYTSTDFHQPTCAIADTDYASNADQVRNCELVGLADLNTGSESVRDKIASYLNALVDVGVAGFRIDAAKHMSVADVDAIVSRVNQHAFAGHLPFIFLEVIDNGAEAIKATEYLNVGASSGQAVSITDFQYAGQFKRFSSDAGPIAQFRTISGQGNPLPSAQAVVFTTNHDTERADAIYFADGKPYDLATVLLLAAPYGYPSLMSSFAFDRATDAGRALGPPSAAMGKTNSIYAAGSKTPNCATDLANPAAGSWVCQHRAGFIAPMLAFRKATVGTDVSKVWDNQNDQLAFARGNKGFVVINRESSALSHSFDTGLPSGSYCDVLTGGLKGGACVGATVTVDEGGMASIDVPMMTAVAIHVGQKK